MAAVGLVVGTALIVLLTKLSSYLTPFKMYFSFSSFLFDDMSNSSWLSLTIKLLIPLIVGYILFTLPFYWMLKGTTSRRSLLARPVSRFPSSGVASHAIAGVQWIDAIRAALIASASTGIAAFYGDFLSNPASLITG